MNSNYIARITSRLNTELGDCPPDLLRLYALLVLTTGTSTTLENVHDAWAAWRDGTRPDHDCLIPFDQLLPHVQEYDRKYMDAIRKVAVELTGVKA